MIIWFGSTTRLRHMIKCSIIDMDMDGARKGQRRCVWILKIKFYFIFNIWPSKFFGKHLLCYRELRFLSFGPPIKFEKSPFFYEKFMPFLHLAPKFFFFFENYHLCNRKLRFLNTPKSHPFLYKKKWMTFFTCGPSNFILFFIYQEIFFWLCPCLIRFSSFLLLFENETNDLIMGRN